MKNNVKLVIVDRSLDMKLSNEFLLILFGTVVLLLF